MRIIRGLVSRNKKSSFLKGSGFFVFCKKISDRKIRILRIDLTALAWQYALIESHNEEGW